MKLSVIFGILHMTIGIFMKATNSVYFERWPELFSEAIAGIVILLCLFGWMDVLIVAKWFHRVDIEDTNPTSHVRMQHETEDEYSPGATEYYTQGDWDNMRSPSIINILIVSVFNFGSYQGTSAEQNDPVIGGSLDNQYGTAVVLLVIAVALIPFMLFFKPLVVLFSNKPEED